MEFARQAAELLHVLHDRAGVIHLDLRLDNFVLTEHGVGFVDFGSAVRCGEDLKANPMLGTIFGELMKTSQIRAHARADDQQRPRHRRRSPARRGRSTRRSICSTSRCR